MFIPNIEYLTLACVIAYSLRSQLLAVSLLQVHSGTTGSPWTIVASSSRTSDTTESHWVGHEEGDSFYDSSSCTGTESCESHDWSNCLVKRGIGWFETASTASTGSIGWSWCCRMDLLSKVVQSIRGSVHASVSILQGNFADNDSEFWSWIGRIPFGKCSNRSNSIRQVLKLVEFLSASVQIGRILFGECSTLVIL